MPEVSANGVRIHYEEHGDGPPPLLISGLGANRLSWLPVLLHLRDAFRCITFDNRGTGQSDVPPGPYTIDDLAGEAAALIEALGIAPAAVGWSMGGSILHSMLINHGEKVRRAVLLSTLPSYTEIQHHWLDALLTLRRADVDPLVQSIIGMPWGFTPRILADHEVAFRAAQLAVRNPCLPDRGAGAGCWRTPERAGRRHPTPRFVSAIIPTRGCPTRQSSNHIDADLKLRAVLR